MSEGSMEEDEKNDLETRIEDVKRRDSGSTQDGNDEGGIEGKEKIDLEIHNEDVDRGNSGSTQARNEEGSVEGSVKNEIDVEVSSVDYGDSISNQPRNDEESREGRYILNELEVGSDEAELGDYQSIQAEIGSGTSEIQKYSDDQLSEINDNDEEIMDIVLSVPEMPKDHVLSSNESETGVEEEISPSLSEDSDITKVHHSPEVNIAIADVLTSDTKASVRENIHAPKEATKDEMMSKRKDTVSPPDTRRQSDEKKSDKFLTKSKTNKIALQNSQWIDHLAAPVIRDPLRPGGFKSRPSVQDYAGPVKSRRRSDKGHHPAVHEAICHVPEWTGDQSQWVVNPAASVPMRPLRWKRMTWLEPQPPVEEWKIEEDSRKEKKDRDMALKQGYDTLLGNLVHIDIPGARDLNRSWNHFLNQDPMAWGFPYCRGSRERPQRPAPAPYLVHQLKEKLWKYPRARLFKAANNE